MTAQIGHNGGPALGGTGFRTLAWRKARAELLPVLPLEIVRLRVKRAKRLGLPYRTYATIRATTGHDIVAFLFSGNALDLGPRRVRLSGPVAERLQALDGAAHRLGAVYGPGRPSEVLEVNARCLDQTFQAPDFLQSWRQTRTGLKTAIRDAGLPSDGVILVPATAVERGWCGAAGLAGIIDRAAFFEASG